MTTNEPTVNELHLGGSGSVTRIRSNSLTITPRSGRGDVQIEGGGAAPVGLGDTLYISYDTFTSSGYVDAPATVDFIHGHLYGYNGGASLAWDNVNHAVDVLLDGVYSIFASVDFSVQSGVVGPGYVEAFIDRRNGAPVDIMSLFADDAINTPGPNLQEHYRVWPQVTWPLKAGSTVDLWVANQSGANMLIRAFLCVVNIAPLVNPPVGP